LVLCYHVSWSIKFKPKNFAEKDSKMKRNRQLMLVLIAVSSFMILVVISAVLLLASRVKSEYTAEVGQEISTDAFRRFDWDKGAFTWLEKPDTSVAGERTGKLYVFPFTYEVTLKVAEPGSSDVGTVPTKAPASTVTEINDITAPVVTTQKVIVYAEDYFAGTVTPEQFIVSVEEESSYTVNMLPQSVEPVFGNTTYCFNVTDSAGNSTDVEAEMFLLNLKKELTLELGSKMPPASAFQYSTEGNAVYVTDVTEMTTINDISEGSYELLLSIDGVEAVSVLNIKDTTAPKLVMKTAETWLNKPLEINDFIDFNQSSDNSDAFDTSFVTEPDWSLLGEQTVTITATDAAGNTVTETTTVLIKKDEKAPVVTVTDIDVKVGSTVSYKKAVSYYDDIDAKEEMTLSIERSSVNLKETGTYEVTYTVTDCSGNSTSVVGKINVLNEAPKWEDEEAIHEKARNVLDSILKDGMTDREKAKAIYKWIKSNVGYIDHSEKGNYTRGAYEGLFKHQGDCFVFAATAKELLTTAGIQNIDIVKSTKNPSHYWNLVYIEDGWYHFDSTPRHGKSEFFLLTDAELEAYSSAHKNTHIFDRSLYPEIK